VATLHANFTYEKVVFDPWHKDSWDVNDIVKQTDPSADPDVGDFFRLLPLGDYSPTWFAQRSGGGLGPEEQDAATKAAAHANTPMTACFDTLGRAFLTVNDNGAAGKYQTRTDLDIEGNQRFVTDSLNRQVMTYDYDMRGNRIHHASMDAGERWNLNNAIGKPIHAWDRRDFVKTISYHELQRPVTLNVTGNGLNSILAEKTIYGDSSNGGLPNPEQTNHRTKVFQAYDAAGIVTNLGVNPATGQSEGYDFKGNLVRSSRQLLQDVLY
jgi:hypothetical protein